MAWVDRNKATPNSLCVFIGGLPVDVQDEELAGFLRKFGRIDDLYISRTPEQRHSKGFAFATFAPGVNKEAIFGEHYFKNKPLEIKLNTHGMLCLAGVPPETQQNAIRKAFDHLGYSTLEVIIGGPGIGVAEGIAFVRLEGSMSHLSALQVGNIILNGKRVSISAKAPRRPAEPATNRGRKRAEPTIERPSIDEFYSHQGEPVIQDPTDTDTTTFSNLRSDGVKKQFVHGTPDTSSSISGLALLPSHRLKKYSAAYQPASLTTLGSPLMSVSGLNFSEKTPSSENRDLLLPSLESMTPLAQLQAFANSGASITAMFGVSEPTQREVWVKFYTFPGMD